MLELTRLRQLGGEDERIKTRLVDEYGESTVDGERFVQRLVFVIHMVADGFLRIRVPQPAGHVGCHQPRLTVDVHAAQLAELGIVEKLNFHCYKN